MVISSKLQDIEANIDYLNGCTKFGYFILRLQTPQLFKYNKHKESERALLYFERKQEKERLEFMEQWKKTWQRSSE